MRSKVLIVILILALFNMHSVQAEESLLVNVKGNSTRFNYDKETETLQLADCRVINVSACHDAWSESPGLDVENPRPWDVPVEYKNAHSVQTLFDEIIAAESVKGITVPHSNAGLTILATPSDNISRFVRIVLTPAASIDGQSSSDVVSVLMIVFNNGKTIHNFVLRSSKLNDLIFAMSESPFELQDMAYATSAMMCAAPYPQYLQQKIDTPKIENVDDVRRITDVLLDAAPMPDTDDMVHYDEQQLLLWLEDGRRMNVYIGGGFYYDDRDTDTQGERLFIRAGSQYYEVDAIALNNALRSASLMTQG